MGTYYNIRVSCRDEAMGKNVSLRTLTEVTNHVSQTNVGGSDGTVTVTTGNNGVATTFTRAKNEDAIRIVNGRVVSGAGKEYVRLVT